MKDLSHAVIAIETGLGPALSGEHFVYLSQRGDVTGEAQIVGSWALADGIAIEPRLGAGWSAQRIGAEDLGSGLTDVEASVRLRHAIGGGLDVYAGVIHERLLGDTRRIARAAGDPAHVTRAIIGAGFAF